MVRPRVLVAEAGGIFWVDGDPGAVGADELGSIVDGPVAAPERFAPTLLAGLPGAAVQERVVYRDGREARVKRVDADVRPLVPGDAGAVDRLGADWIASTWDDSAGLAGSGMAWGAFRGTELASVACVFFAGMRYCELAVVTASDWRGRGLATACAAAVAGHVRQAGRVPCWTTTPRNTGSRTVAERIGMTFVRDDRLYLPATD